MFRTAANSVVVYPGAASVYGTDINKLIFFYIFIAYTNASFVHIIYMYTELNIFINQIMITMLKSQI